ncbi:major tail subunit, partial [Mycolicibacterium canariasense]
GDFVSPFAADGNWRDDLLAVKIVNRRQVYNQAANHGFHKIGCVNPDGFVQEHDTNVDALEILQSIDPARVDMTSREKRVVFTGFENNRVLHRLLNDLPLTNILHPSKAGATYVVEESDEIDFVERQFILIHEDKAAGLPERTAFGLSRAVRSEIGNLQGSKTDPTAAELKFTRLIDPNFIGTKGQPLISCMWVAGEAWEEYDTPGLTFVPPRPVGTPTAATTANLVFEQPLGGKSPYTYAVKKSATEDMAAPTDAVVGSTNVANGFVTLGLTGLTTATTSFYQVEVTDDDDVTAVSAVSNSVTQP